MGYKYETHLHTCQASACGRSLGREHVRHYKDLGYTGIFVTDHFYRGNTAIDRAQPWDKWVDAYCRGYEDAREAGEQVGLDVFFGWEESIEGDDYLIYGLDGEWLKAHPEARTWTRRQQFETVHAGGGCVVQAHPFRTRDYISRIHLADKYVDGVEVANAGNEHFNDVYAYRYASELGTVMTAGSDNHHSTAEMGSEGRIYGVELEERLTCAQDYARLIRSGVQPGLVCPVDRFDPAFARPLPLDTCFLGPEDEKLPVVFHWFDA